MLNLKNLVASVAKLEKSFTDDTNCGWGWLSGYDSETGAPQWNHWSGARDELRMQHGQLEDSDICVLSLSLGFGPTPGMTDEQVRRVYAQLYPQGRQRGGAYTPRQVLQAVLNADDGVVWVDCGHTFAVAVAGQLVIWTSALDQIHRFQAMIKAGLVTLLTEEESSDEHTYGTIQVLLG